MASVAQLLDVLHDLERAHEAYRVMEEERRRHSLHHSVAERWDSAAAYSDNNNSTGS